MLEQDGSWWMDDDGPKDDQMLILEKYEREKLNGLKAKV